MKHKIPSGIYSGETGVTVLCSNPTGFTCAGAGYNGTSSQIGGHGWTYKDYWTSGSTGPNGTKHNCTTYAAYRLQQNGYAYPGWTGDARDWATKAQSHVTVNQTPAVGSIAQWNGNHVAYVEAVTASYIITTSDSYQAPGKPAYGTDRLEIARNSPYMPDNFIHFKDLKATLPAQPGGLSATSPTTSSLVLHWSESAIDVTGFVTHYRIANGAWHAGPSVGPNVRSVTVGGLQPGKRYTFQVGVQNSAGTHWSAYFYGSIKEQPTPPPVSNPPTPAPAPYHAGKQVTIASQATGGVTGHTGPGNQYQTEPTNHAKSTPLWIVCYVNGQQIKGPYDTTPMWDFSDDGYYYTDAWLYTGTNGPAVPPCALRTVTIASQATGGVSGHQGPGNQYKASPTTHAKSTPITIACYVTGQQITGPYDTTTMWDLATDGYYYTDAWLYTGTNGAAVPHC